MNQVALIGAVATSPEKQRAADPDGCVRLRLRPRFSKATVEVRLSRALASAVLPVQDAGTLAIDGYLEASDEGALVVAENAVWLRLPADGPP